jgi:hypothetical protein
MPPSVVAVVSAARCTTLERRTAALQEILGPVSEVPEVLHRRAEIVTALRVAELWPVEGYRR